jgi:uncharacterized protein (DUF2062 family)
MRFRRREKRTRAQKLRQWVWPESGWWRTFLYIWRKVWRLADSPHAIALGFAAGAFASFTPLWTLHFVVAALIAWVFGGNILASAFGTVVGNPITFPFIVPAIYETGSLILGHAGALQEFDLWGSIMSGNFSALAPSWVPMMVGGLIIGPIIGVICYFVVRTTVATYQERRRIRLEAQASAGLQAGAAHAPIQAPVEATGGDMESR